jgi:hypothetical protein
LAAAVLVVMVAAAGEASISEAVDRAAAPEPGATGNIEIGFTGEKTR